MLFLHREEGQGLVEYALILVLIAIVVVALLVGVALAFVVLITLEWILRRRHHMV